MQYVCGQMSRAALYKEPVSRLPAAASCLGRHAHPAGRSPNSSSLFLPLAAVVAVAQGLFSPPDYSAGRCCSNPPLQPLFKADKTETPVPGSDTGVLGGRGWIRTTEAESSRFTVCPHWPLGNTPIFFCVRRADCLYILPRAKQFVNHLQQILSQFLHQSLQQTRPMEKPPGNQCSRAVFLGAGDRS